MKGLVAKGVGRHQSYLISGGYGCGKTTIGRILARALLCDAPISGEPCDTCDSCLLMLEGGNHDAFVEVDAASKSGKDDVERILNDLEIMTFSGKKRIYLFDESHRLSEEAKR
jgi:DNA polymerase-3 subunit gamma/tau